MEIGPTDDWGMMEDRGSGFEGKSGFALLGRRESGFLEVLALSVEEGKVLCLFETQELANAFSRLSPDIRGQGWQVYVMTTDKLPDLLEDFRYATINPSPQANSRKELVSAAGLARSLRARHERETE